MGDGYSVEIATNKNAGSSYDTAVVVTKNNESGTIGVASEAGHPRRSAQTVPNSSAKLDNSLATTKELDKLSNAISKKGKMGAHEFLYSLSRAFGYTEESLKKSYYKDLGEGVGIRIANHYANAENFEKKGDNEENYGVVVKLSPSHFKDKEGVDYLEYVYFPDKLSGERESEIVDGLKAFLQTGDFTKLPKPDKVNPSGRFKDELKLRTVYGGNSGYVGYSKSKRAVEAERQGMRSVSNFDRDFVDSVNAVLYEVGAKGITIAEAMRLAKKAEADEWHHTSMYGNKTNYYSTETIVEEAMDESQREAQNLWGQRVRARKP